MTNPKGWDETAMGPTDTEETGSAAASYTPGPWRMDEFSDPGASLATYGVWTDKEWNKTRCIAAMEDGPDAESNARLISAAPELLEALKTARQYVATVHGQLAGAVGVNNAVAPDLAAVDRAIAKATGVASDRE